MTVNIIFSIVLVFLLILCIIGYKKAKKISIYRYRIIAYFSMIPAIIITLAIHLRDMVFNSGSEERFVDFILELPGRFAMVSIGCFAILGIMMAISNVSLIRHEGVSVKNALGTIMYLGLILGTTIVYILVYVFDKKGFFEQNSNTAVRVICNFVSFLLYSLIDYAECIIVGIMILGAVAARQKPAYDKDFIIIPGCSIRKDGGLLPLLKGRVNRAIKYAWQQEIETGKPLYYIPSGGQGEDEIMSEGSAMEFYLLSHSAEQEEIFAEKKSRNTYENFKFSKRIIDEKKTDAKVAFATTNYHMLRCGLLARKLGLEVEGIASSTKWYFWPNGFARETVAVAFMTKKYHFLAGFMAVVLSAVLCFLSEL